jgi:hypothetical protein
MGPAMTSRQVQELHMFEMMDIKKEPGNKIYCIWYLPPGFNPVAQLVGTEAKTEQEAKDKASRAPYVQKILSIKEYTNAEDHLRSVRPGTTGLRDPGLPARDGNLPTVVYGIFQEVDDLEGLHTNPHLIDLYYNKKHAEQKQFWLTGLQTELSRSLNPYTVEEIEINP